MIRQALTVLVVCLCAVSLSLHFAVESMREGPGRFVGGQAGASFDAHEEDQFVWNEAGIGNPVQAWFSLPLPTQLKIVFRPLTPLFPPPKSI